MATASIARLLRISAYLLGGYDCVYGSGIWWGAMTVGIAAVFGIAAYCVDESCTFSWQCGYLLGYARYSGMWLVCWRSGLDFSGVILPHWLLAAPRP